MISNYFNYMVNLIKNIKKQDKIIKELEKANEELKYKHQLKNEFINIAAHEIKTPIQPIIALSELLLTYSPNFVTNIFDEFTKDSASVSNIRCVNSSIEPIFSSLDLIILFAMIILSEIHL